MEYKHILAAIEPYLIENIKSMSGATAFCFHDKTHVNDVVSAVEVMADHYALSERDRFVVTCAAYFHDVGYLNGGPHEHETRSATFAEDFLKKNKIDEELIMQVKRCILATKMPQHPNDLLEQIICDADLYHFGGDNFQERNKLMRKEAERLLGKAIDKSVWREKTILLMGNHHYHTAFAQQTREQKKQDNLQVLKSKKDLENNKVDKKVGEADRKSRPERGIETMFRITSSNNQRLSDMADNKANILLTVNSIILSVIVVGLFRKLDNNEHLIIPTFILVIAVVMTMVLAILSTIPKIPSGVFKKEDVQNKTVNLLFFGNFFKVPFQDYKEGMDKVMEDSDFLYGMMTKDVYSQGVVLGRKYKLLRYAYGVFMFGLIISVIAFLISIITY